jgi:hypothetical protein
MPGKHGLKKCKSDIEFDLNPITNGTIDQRSYLGAVKIK